MTSREEIVAVHMRPATGQRVQKCIIFTIVAVLVFQFHTISIHRPFRLSYLTFSSSGSSICDPIPVPPALDYNGQSWDTWIGLEQTFKRFKPQSELEHRDFPQGQTTTPTEDLLHDFLNLTSSEAWSMRQMHENLVDALPEYPDQVFEGQGIVMVSGGRYSEYAATTLGMLRLTGSRLPVELWLKDSTEEEEGWCDELTDDGISCRYLSDYLGEMKAFPNPYQYKVAAIFFSSFEEILFLDSDSIPVKNPDYIFYSPAYQDTGLVLWPDYWTSTESPWLPFITGQSEEPNRSVPNISTVDSGQMLWDKQRHWKTLCLSAYYNYYGPQYFYSLITQGGPGWGDKDTFPTALRALSLNFTQIPHLETQHFSDGNDRPTGTGMAMLQAEPWDLDTFQPLFLHSNVIQFSVRRLMCKNCTERPSALTTEQRSRDAEIFFLGQAHDRKHVNWAALNHRKRIFATMGDAGLNHLGVLDTERDLWRVMERSACVGVWSEKGLCQRTRRHLKLTFGLGESWLGAREEACMGMEV